MAGTAGIMEYHSIFGVTVEENFQLWPDTTLRGNSTDSGGLWFCLRVVNGRRDEGAVHSFE